MRKKLFGLLVAIILLVGLTVPLVVGAVGYTQYEYWNTADDADVDIYAPNQYGQTFTTNATAPHTVAQVRLKLFRVGAPGTLTVYIFETDGGHPTGLPIGEGTISGDSLTTGTSGTWYVVTLDEEVSLGAATQYATVCAVKGGTATDYVAWRYDNGNGYADGTEESSTNGGVSWSTTGANDMMFEIWGNPGIKVVDAKVFSNFVEDGDQLFVFTYQVMVSEDYIAKTPQDYFHMQLLEGETVVAQAKLPAWGYKPGSIYLSADEALPWGVTTDKIKITGIVGSDFNGTSSDYTLVASDWVGQDLEQLDDWVVAAASHMEFFYGTSLVNSQEGEYMLNEVGGTVFITGIPGLAEVRPHLFGEVPAGDMPPGKTHTTDYQDTLIGNFGARATAAFADIGDLVGVSGGFIGGVFWGFIMVAAVSLLGLATGNTSIALISAIPFLFIGNYLGIIPLVYTLIPTFLIATYVVAMLTIWRA